MMKVVDKCCCVNKRKCWVEGLAEKMLFGRNFGGPSALRGTSLLAGTPKTKP